MIMKLETLSKNLPVTLTDSSIVDLFSQIPVWKRFAKSMMRGFSGLARGFFADRLNYFQVEFPIFLVSRGLNCFVTIVKTFTILNPVDTPA